MCLRKRKSKSLFREMKIRFKVFDLYELQGKLSNINLFLYVGFFLDKVWINVFDFDLIF